MHQIMHIRTKRNKDSKAILKDVLKPPQALNSCWRVFSLNRYVLMVQDFGGCIWPSVITILSQLISLAIFLDIISSAIWNLGLISITNTEKTGVRELQKPSVGHEGILCQLCLLWKLIYDTTDLFLRAPAKAAKGPAQESFLYEMEQRLRKYYV